LLELGSGGNIGKDAAQIDGDMRWRKKGIAANGAVPGDVPLHSITAELTESAASQQYQGSGTEAASLMRALASTRAEKVVLAIDGGYS